MHKMCGNAAKLYSIEKWIQQRFARYPRGNPFVWGIAPPMAHMTEVLKRSKLYIDAHHILIRIEYNTALSKKAKKSASRSIVTILKGLVEPSATYHAAAIRSPSQMRLDPIDCYLCMAQEEPVCDNCYAKIEQIHYALVCKKIGNNLLDHLLRSKAEKLAQQNESTKKQQQQMKEKEIRRAKLENMRQRLASLRQQNSATYERIQELKSQVKVVKEQNLKIMPIFDDTELVAIEEKFNTAKIAFAEKTKSLSEMRHALLVDMMMLHHIDHGLDDPTDVPGHPKVRLPKAPSRAPPGAIGTLNAPGSSTTITPPKPGAKPNLSKLTWHFMHQAFSMDGNLLKTMPSPTSTLVPFLVFLCRVAHWWNCALPYPIEPVPVPRIYCPALVNHHPAVGFTPLHDGWHVISVVSASQASEYDHNIHQLVADNARTLIRAVKTFPEDAIDLNEHWLNTFFFTFHTQYVRAFHQPKLAPTTLSSSTVAQNLGNSALGASVAGFTSPPPAAHSNDFPAPHTKRSRAASRIVVSYVPGDNNLSTSVASPTISSPSSSAISDVHTSPKLHTRMSSTESTASSASLMSACSGTSDENGTLSFVAIPPPNDPDWVSFLK